MGYVGPMSGDTGSGLFALLLAGIVRGAYVNSGVLTGKVGPIGSSGDAGSGSGRGRFEYVKSGVLTGNVGPSGGSGEISRTGVFFLWAGSVEAA
jgi:hypothetical protein